MSEVKKVSKGQTSPGTIGDLLRTKKGGVEFLNKHAVQKVTEIEEELKKHIRAKMYGYFWLTKSRGFERG